MVTSGPWPIKPSTALSSQLLKSASEPAGTRTMQPSRRWDALAFDQAFGAGFGDRKGERRREATRSIPSLKRRGTLSIRWRRE